MSALAEGDINAKIVTGTTKIDITGADEFGSLAVSLNSIIEQTQLTVKAFLTTQASLNGIIGQADAAARAISESSAHLASGMEEFAEGNLSVKVKSDGGRVELTGNGDFAILAKSFAKIFDSTDQISIAFRSAQGSLGDLISQTNAAALASGVSAANLAAGLTALAEGDLAVKLPPQVVQIQIASKGDFATLSASFKDIFEGTTKSDEAFRHAQQSLSALISHCATASEQIAAASNQLASGNEDLASRTAEQASSLEETAAAMEEMTSIVKLNATNASHASEVTTDASSLALSGGQVVEQAVGAMRAIDEASKRISEIISEIDEIAFQTNLLALNAAVEAARVGEQGRGFAVVASEVRNLAGRSSTAAKEIKSLVQDSASKVVLGSELVNKSGEHLQRIVDSSNKVAKIVADICTASEEQSAGIGQVNKAIIQMDEITQANSALVEEGASASEEVSQQARELRDLVRKFKVDERLLTIDHAPVEAKPVIKRAPIAPKLNSASPKRPALKIVGGRDDTMSEF
jgi:methyl-accepting chemotaxis protein